MWITYVILGVVTGSLNGLLGIGGGLLLVPAFVYVLGMSQKLAQGTCIAMMVPPISILAAWHYWKKGYVDLHIAAWVCLGFIIGSGIGSLAIGHLEQETLQRIFGVVLLVVSIKMLVF